MKSNLREPSVIRLALGALAAVAFTILTAGPLHAKTGPEADRYAGSFQGQGLVLHLQPIPADYGQYTGDLLMGDKRFPLTAHNDGTRLAGEFVSQGTAFAFTAAASSGGLELWTGASVYRLQALSPRGVPPAGFEVVAHAEKGQTLAATRDDVRSARALLSTTAAGFSNFFDAKLNVTEGYADSQDQNGIADFSANLAGKPVRGVLLATIGPKGATAAVAYAQNDAPAGVLQRLIAAAQPNGKLEWSAAQIPDGSGSLRLPQNWKITGADGGAVRVNGPNGESLVLGNTLYCMTPELAAADERRQQLLAQTGWKPQPHTLPVLPLLEPVEAVRQLAAWSEKANPALRLIEIAESAPIKTPTGQGAIVSVVSELKTGKTVVRFRTITVVICQPVGNGYWQYFYSQASVPEEFFDRDMPVLLKIWQSRQLDARWVQGQLNQAASNLHAASEALNRSAARTFQSASHQSVEWDEIVSGCTSVRDEQTGQTRTVNTATAGDTIRRLNDKAGFAKYKKVALDQG